MASDYRDTPAPVHASAPTRNPFESLKLNLAPVIAVRPTPLERAVERYARAATDIMRMRSAGLDALPHQRVAFADAGKALDTVQPNGAHDLRRAFNAEPTLIAKAAKGKTAAAMRALAMQAEIRIDGVQRADRFIADWQRKLRQLEAVARAGDHEAIDRARTGMIDMAKTLHRDPQLESLLRNRAKDLGIGKPSGASLSHELQQTLAPWRSRGLGR